MWKGVWGLQSPKKVKNLLWRACRNAIPTKENLVRCTILEDPVYDRCNGALENSLHAPWSCFELDIVWTNLVLWNFRRTCMFMDFKELLSWVIQQDKNPKLFSMTAWLIWTQQNQVCLAQPNVNLHLLEQVSKDWHEEFIALQVPRLWQPTLLAGFKINFDGATIAVENKSGIEVVIRDSQGRVIASLSQLPP